MRHSQIVGSSAVMSVALATMLTMTKPAAAQEYCVACSGPDALYRCVLERAAPSGIPLKFLCITFLARDGGHAACSVRSGTVFDCDAPIRRIDATSAAEILSAPPTAEAPQADGLRPGSTTIGFTPGRTSDTGSPGAPGLGPGGQDQPRPDDHPQARPDKSDTVEDLAKNFSRSSKEALAKAGEGIKSTTRKTWDCVASFFKSC